MGLLFRKASAISARTQTTYDSNAGDESDNAIRQQAALPGVAINEYKAAANINGSIDDNI